MTTYVTTATVHCHEKEASASNLNFTHSFFSIVAGFFYRRPTLYQIWPRIKRNG